MASHNLNDMSSRSHAMLSIQIEQDLQDYEDPQQQITRQGKLIFVDLAGEFNRYDFLFDSSTFPFACFFLQEVKKSKLVILKANNLSKQIISTKVYSPWVRSSSHTRSIIRLFSL